MDSWHSDTLSQRTSAFNPLNNLLLVVEGSEGRGRTLIGLVLIILLLPLSEGFWNSTIKWKMNQIDGGNESFVWDGSERRAPGRHEVWEFEQGSSLSRGSPREAEHGENCQATLGRGEGAGGLTFGLLLVGK